MTDSPRGDLGLKPNTSGTQSAARELERECMTLPVLESVKWLSTSQVALYLGYLIYQLVFGHAGANGTIVILSVFMLTLNAGLSFVSFRRMIEPRWAHFMGAGITLSTAISLLASAFIEQSVTSLVFFPLLLIASGAVVLSPYWLLSLALPVLTANVIAAERLLRGPFLLHYVAYLVAALVLMLNVFVNRRRVHRHVLGLRESDLKQAASLKEALDRSELRLRERQQTDLRRQELEDQLRQAQKLEAVGVLAGGVAHDMNNVLGVITSIASLASDRIEAGSSLSQDITDILSAARRGSALTRNLLGFARQGTRFTERFRMENTLDSITHLLRRTISKQIDLKLETSFELDDIVGDQGQLSHVLMNVCINALDALQGRGAIIIRASNTRIDADLALKHDIPEGRYIELSVEDNGAGIPPDVLPHVFEPFFSTKSSNERSGLGLSMVYGTVRDHGGAVTIDSAVGCGTKVRVLLPSQVSRPASVSPAAVRAVRPTETRRTILLVDDEPLLRSAARRTIKGMGFDALVAANGAEAVAVFRRQHDSIALVVLDVAMPIMGGRDCFWRLREIDPDIPVLVASGYAKHGDVDELLSAGATGYLSKPYDRDQMVTAIHRCLALSLTMTAAQPVSEQPPSRRNAAL